MSTLTTCLASAPTRRGHSRLVRELYGHPDQAIARQRIRDAFAATGQVKALPPVRATA
jgi:hypothetical protein